MKNSSEFIIQLRSRFLDAINNLLMQMMNPDFGSDTETKEQLITRLKIEAEYLEKKRNGILFDIEKHLSEK